jgi:hypothetical protein
MTLVLCAHPWLDTPGQASQRTRTDFCPPHPKGAIGCNRVQ